MILKNPEEEVQEEEGAEEEKKEPTAEEKLAELQERIMAVREILLMGDKSWLAGAMYGIHTLGIGSGHVPRPIQGLNNKQKKEMIQPSLIIF